MENLELALHRTDRYTKSTLGFMTVAGERECLTLEDRVRLDDPATPDVDEGAKIYGETAIPAGRYRITITYSPKFKKMMLLVNNVPGYTGIRIHSGNTDHDTLGCILVGQHKLGDDYIQGGSQALPLLFAKIQKAIGDGKEVWITITNDFEVAA